MRLRSRRQTPSGCSCLCCSDRRRQAVSRRGSSYLCPRCVVAAACVIACCSDDVTCDGCCVVAVLADASAAALAAALQWQLFLQLLQPLPLLQQLPAAAVSGLGCTVGSQGHSCGCLGCAVGSQGHVGCEMGLQGRSSPLLSSVVVVAVAACQCLGCCIGASAAAWALTVSRTPAPAASESCSRLHQASSLHCRRSRCHHCCRGLVTASVVLPAFLQLSKAAACSPQRPRGLPSGQQQSSAEISPTFLLCS